MKLNDYCIKQGITMRSLAENLGFSYNYFMHCASGIERFSYKRAKAISEYCNGEVTVDELIPYEKPERCSDPRCNRILAKKYWKK